jgi:hypothetical protein
LILAIILLIVGINKKYIFKKEPKQLYEVAIMVRNQTNSNEEEDKRTSLKIGDVLLVQKVGHKWSRTERVSYLLLKMNLTKSQIEKLTKPIEKKLSKREINKELEEFKQNKADIPQEELKRFTDELKKRRKTILMRQYRINMEKYFSDFKANDLIQGQPFKDQIFDWKVVEKK